MNLLMILLIVLGLWVGAGVCYVAWTLMPKVPGPAEQGTDGTGARNDNGEP